MEYRFARFFAALILLVLASCSERDQQRARRDAEEAKVKTRRAAQELKQDAKRLGHEVREESRQLSSNIDRAVQGSPGEESPRDKLRHGAAELRTAGKEAGTKLEHVGLLAKVKAKLATDVGASSITNVNVDVQGNTVTLRGKVPSDEQRRSAERAAQEVEGVSQVRNRLVVEP